MDERADPAAVDGIGVARKMAVAIWAGWVTEGFTDCGVDAESVANRSVVGAGVAIPMLQADNASRIPIQKINLPYSLRFGRFKVELHSRNNLCAHAPAIRT